MKKAVLLLPAFVLALSASAFAQGVSKGKDRTETVNIQVSGTWDVDFIFQSRELSQWRSGGLTGSTTDFSPEMWVRLDVELSDKCSAVIEWGMHALRGIGNDGFTPEMGQVYAQLADMFMEGLTVKIGQVRHVFAVHGSSIVLDTFYSDPYSTSQSPDGRSGAAYSWSAGAVVTYAREAIQVDVFLLPKNNDDGGFSTAKSDEAIYGFDFWYKLDSLSKGSRIGALFTAISDAAGSGAAFTLGIGAELFFMADNALCVFAEVYFQFGDSGSDQVDASGLAFQIGARYNFASDMKPWIELKVTWLSGDDGSDVDDNENWQAKENQADLMILESEVYGVDWDTNYFCVKLMGGLGFMNEGGSNKLWLGIAIGFATANEEVVASEDSLGIEVDLKVTYNYSKAVNLDTGIAANFGNDVMENSIAENDDSSFLFWLGANARW